MAIGTDQGLIDYLSLTGRALPPGASPSVARQWGTMYVGLFEDKYKGVAISPPDPFPRDIYNPTPIQVEYATYEASLAWADGVDLFGTGGTVGGQVTEVRIDVISEKYAAPESGSGFGGYWDNNRFILPLAYALLLPFMRKAGGIPAAFVVGGCRSGC